MKQMKLCSKRDYTDLMHRMIDPLKPLYSQGCARLRIGGAGVTYDINAIELEAFSRPLWALVPFWAGGGQDGDFEEIYRKGLAAGTDPQHEEYWGGFSDYDQRFVEMAAIACGLLFAPHVLWEPLTLAQKQNVAVWLSGINEYTIPDCNWQFFRVLVNLALQCHGVGGSTQKLEESLQKLEDYYLGDGWYQDGASCQKDYYISFAMHYYGLVYAKAMEKTDPERSARYRERALVFAQDFIYWFADSGEALPYGRSLAYRFGQGAFWSACLSSGVQPYSTGVIKGILSRHMEYWQQQDIADRDGVLTVGYAYPNLIMAERYNAPGSPYWGLKSFILLALPDDHPVWAVPCEPIPHLERLKPLYRADMLVQRLEKDVIAYPAAVCERYGHGHLPEKYSKFAYSTHFGFCCAHSQISLHENCPDSMLAFVPDGDDYVFVRKRSLRWQVLAESVVSEWCALPGINVKTTITPTLTGHLRRHEIESQYDCDAYDCGFAVQRFVSGEMKRLEESGSTVGNDSGFCTVCGDGEPCFVGADPNTNILYRNVEIPAIKYRVPKGKTVLQTEVISSCCSCE